MYDWNAEEDPSAGQSSPSQTSGSEEPVIVSPVHSVGSNMSQQSSSSSLPAAPPQTDLNISAKPKPQIRKKPTRSSLPEIPGDQELKTKPIRRENASDPKNEPAVPKAAARRMSKAPDKDLKEEIRNLRMKVTELENKLEIFEEDKHAEHEGLNQQVIDLTEENQTLINKRNNLIEQNNDLTERNVSLSAEFDQMEKSVEEKDDEIKRLRGQIRKGPVSVKDFNQLKKDFENLDAHNDEVQKELDHQIERKDYYKELIRKKDEETAAYHKQMEDHIATQIPKKAYQECLQAMEDLKLENSRMNEEINVKWRQALMNSESRYQYFLQHNNIMKQQNEKMWNDLKWKNSELESAKQRIEIQDTEIRRLARAEEDLHANIKQAYNEQEKIMHEKMQAEMHLQDREAINKELERKRLEMEAKIKEGEKARNDLMTSRKRYESDTKTQMEKYKREREDAMGKLEEIEEGNILTCIICYDPYDDADHFCAALPCGHRYGNTCIRTSLQRNGKCPSCMKNFGVNDVIRLFVQ